ncbi:MAG: branched-chain amino acid aminotransferase [Gemmatimonadota bacterium]|nr:branched-chain amino acid aminotransferase [Gemmatimonadota bacterium]
MTASWTFFDDEWKSGNVPLIGSMTQAVWLSSIVFDGARAFDGLAPDLDLHAARAIDSARKMGLEPREDVDEIVRRCEEGVRKFGSDAALYIRPMFFGEGGFIIPEPDSARFALVIHELPMPAASGFSACLSKYRRPSPETAVTDAKASALYPNVARALAAARARGFDNAVKLDLNGNVAEFATSNLFMVKDGVAHTPTPNGTFLNGITKQRVTNLLREDGVEVVERRVTWNDLVDADEVFSTGNHGKVVPCVRLEDREVGRGKVGERARKLYFEFAKEHPVR